MKMTFDLIAVLIINLYTAMLSLHHQADASSA